MKQLTTIQNGIIKIICFAPFGMHNTQQFYKELELLNLEQIHRLQVAKFMYKHKTQKLPEQINHVLSSTEPTHSYNLRSMTNSNYRQVWGRTSYSQKMLKNEGVKVWNNIPI